MGALASMDQHRDVSERVEMLARGNEVLFSARDGFKPVGEGCGNGAFFSPTLILCRNGMSNDAVHDVEAFGPVSTMMTYRDIDEALHLAARGKGSLVTTLVTKDPAIAAHAVPVAAASHGGPGRAGGGEELGGIRAVKHFLQRAAVQGSPTMLTAVTGEYVRGAEVKESEVHPFRRWFEDLEIGHSLLTHRRTVSEADIVNFGGVSGDYFYMHFDEIAAKDTQFGKRIAHGYFVLSAAAGLFVSPAPGPVLANYGLDNLRFVAPVAIGDTIRARLTCKRKVDRNRTDEQGRGQGVVAWDVQVTNQHDELVASYDILTLVQKRG
jgi:oxepin-CoA hydrolase/3-oxo-5,6-dehydrosuberyl-CoA semialdehyde dehydrogenase